jgi:hypothetical protein
MNRFAIHEYFHQISKSLRLRVSGEHSTVYQRQGSATALDEFVNFRHLILEKRQSVISLVVSPEIIGCP